MRYDIPGSIPFKDDELPVFFSISFHFLPSLLAAAWSPNLNRRKWHRCCLSDISAQTFRCAKRSAAASPSV